MTSPPPKARPSVLVVDDEPDLREMLALGLQLEGFEVTTAGGGEAALASLYERTFDLVLTDLKMPGMDGVATLAALKQLEPDLEVLILTGYASVETAIDCLRLGARDYLTKPCEMSELVAALKRAWAHRQREPVGPFIEISRTLLTTPSDELEVAAVKLVEPVVFADAVGLLYRSVMAPARWSWSGASAPAEEAMRARLATATRGHLEPQVLDLTEPSRFTRALACPLSVGDAERGTLVFLRGPQRSRFTRNDQRRAALAAVLLALVLDRRRPG